MNWILIFWICCLEVAINNLKKRILEFAKDIQLGRVSNYEQKQLYESRFSSSVLVKSWGDMLFKK